MIALILCIVLLIPDVSKASNDIPIGIIQRDRMYQFDSYNNLACSALFIGNKENSSALLDMVNALDDMVDLSNKSYIIHINTDDEIMSVSAKVFDDLYDGLAIYFGAMEYTTRYPEEVYLGDFLNKNKLDETSFDDNPINNGFENKFVLYKENMTSVDYSCYFYLDTLEFTKWTFYDGSTKQYNYDLENDDFKFYQYGDNYADNYVVVSSNIPIYTVTDLVGNGFICKSDSQHNKYYSSEYSVNGYQCCFNEYFNSLTNINVGSIYTNNGYEDGSGGGGSDGSEHHLYLRDFSVQVISKKRLTQRYNLKDYLDGTANEDAYIALGYSLDKYQSENLYDFQIKVDIKDINGNVKTRYLPLSNMGITYIPLTPILLDNNYNWYDNLTFYEIFRSTNSYKGHNVVEFSYSYNTTRPVYDSDGNRITPDWNHYKDYIDVTCQLVYLEDVSNTYNKIIYLYGGTKENDNGMGNNENPYVPDDDEYTGNDVVPTPDYSSDENGINIVINNTNNNDDDDINLIIEDDDYTDDALREDIKDGFGLIDNLDTPEKADGFIGLVSDFYTNTLDENFKKIIMFGLSSVVAIAIIRAVFRR